MLNTLAAFSACFLRMRIGDTIDAIKRTASSFGVDADLMFDALCSGSSIRAAEILGIDADMLDAVVSSLVENKN